MSKSTHMEEFGEGKVRKTMEAIVDEVEKFREEKSKQKEIKGKVNG